MVKDWLGVQPDQSQMGITCESTTLSAIFVIELICNQWQNIPSTEISCSKEGRGLGVRPRVQAVGGHEFNLALSTLCVGPQGKVEVVGRVGFLFLSSLEVTP